jgi:DNA polymerase-4
MNISLPLRWLYVDFNSYFASVEQQLEPRLRGRPVAVVPVETDATCAIAASYEAKAFGVRTGTPIWEAKRLCPGLICVLARHDEYVEFHHRILAEIDRHLPVSAVCSIDEMACRLMDNEIAEPVIRRIAGGVKQGLAARVGAFVRCSIGVSSNRYLAKVATDLQKPNGMVVLYPGEVEEKLSRLALRDLPGIGRNMERRLLAAGIGNFAALWGLRAEELKAIWGGVEGTRFWQALRGIEVPEIATQHRSVGHSHVMAPELRAPPQAIFVARRLTQKAASRLRRMDYYATALSFSARLENGLRLQENEATWRTQDSLKFLDLLEGMWARSVNRVPGARVKKVSVVLHGLIAAADVQPDLLEMRPDALGPPRNRAEVLCHTLDKLNQRYGRDTVSIGMLPEQGRSFSGSKIAFTRIPKMEEFRE